MPSNKDLKLEATALAENLGVDITLKGFGNNQLRDLVSDLKAKIKDRDTITQVDVVAPPIPPPVLQPLIMPVYKVAEGKAITCKKGMLSDGAEIKADYLGGGQVSLDALVEKNHVIKS